MKDRLDKVNKWSPLASLVLVIILCIYGAITIPYFFKASYLVGLLKNYTPMILVSVGMSVVIIGGGIDLAIGTIASLVNVIVMLCSVQYGMSIWLSMLIGIGVGLMCGIINGSIIAFARLNPLISSFAFSWITGGIALWMVPDANKYDLATDMVNFYKGSVIGIPVPVILIVISVVVWEIIMKMNAGVGVYALGNNMKNAYTTGISIEKARILSYAFSGFCAAMAGIAMTGAMGGGYASIGDGYTVKAIAACVIGGIALTGGKGSVIGGVTGGVFIGLLAALVISSPIDPLKQGFVTNLIILISILIPSMIAAYKNSQFRMNVNDRFFNKKKGER